MSTDTRFKLGEIALTQNCLLELQNNLEVEIVKLYGLYKAFKMFEGNKIYSEQYYWIVRNKEGERYAIQSHQLRKKPAPRDEIGYTRFMEKILSNTVPTITDKA